MPEFGHYVRDTDARLCNLIWREATSSRDVSIYQREILMGNEPWSRNEDRSFDFLKRLGIACHLSADSARGWDDAIATYSADMPPVDPKLPELLKQWRIHTTYIEVLSVESLVEVVGIHQVPIIKCVTFGDIEGKTGGRRIGVQKDVYVVGRMDVRQVFEVHKGYKQSDDGRKIVDVMGKVLGDVEQTTRGRFRPTLRKARITASRVDAAIPAWDAYLDEQKALRAALAEAKARAEQAAAVEDEGVLSF